MNSDQHVLIIGAGIVGVSAALNLQRRGFRVTLADRQAPGDGASFGNGGILVPGGIVPVPVPGLARKAPGMLLRAARDLRLDLGRSWLVGDALRDLEAGRAAGVRGLLVRTGKGASELARWDAGDGPEPEHVSDLAAAAELILARG